MIAKWEFLREWHGDDDVVLHVVGDNGCLWVANGEALESHISELGRPRRVGFDI